MTMLAPLTIVWVSVTSSAGTRNTHPVYHRLAACHKRKAYPPRIRTSLDDATRAGLKPCSACAEVGA